MSYHDRRDDPVRQQFAARTRDHYLAKMRRALDMPTKGATPEQAPATPNQESTQAVCTCDDMGECDVCRDWSRRMLELAKGKP